MATSRIAVSAPVAAPAPLVYRMLADYREHHPRILPRPPFGALVVEEGGVGAGTRVRVTMRAGGQDRVLVLRVSEPEPGRVIEEVDQEGASTRFTVEPEGAGCRVEIATTLAPKRGLASVVERLVVGPFLRSTYRKELANLDAYARSLNAP